MKPIIQALKGTRDFYPVEMQKRNWLYARIREVSESFGYMEYEGPFLEKISLYAAKSGEELVKEQAFVFEDRGGELVTLRPELTPTLARMVAQKQNELIVPLKWWSFGPFWRYERPQKGRTREFFQWNIDLIGGNNPVCDAELICIVAEFFRKVGLTPEMVKIKVNHRKLMEEAILGIGIPLERKAFILKLIDRKDKLPLEAWQKYALDNEVQPVELEKLVAVLTDKDLWKKSEALVAVFNVLEKMGCSDYVEFDPQVIRGLDYYTGTVFEARDISGANRAILGGGHYDNLVSDVGGSPLPGVGFAMGDVVIGLLLEEHKLLPEMNSNLASVLVTQFDSIGSDKAVEVAENLRKAGIKVNLYPEPVKLDKQLKYADRLGFRFVVIIGPDEAAKKQVMLKDLRDHSQQAVSQGELAAHLARLLENH
jgi:histidyl-tRNA synthetase